MKKFLTPKRLLILFVAVNLVIGIFTASDYGISIDESQETDRAEIAMRRYTLHETGNPIGEYEALGINQYYGTVLMMGFLFFEKTFQPLLGTERHAILHYTFFVTFQIGIVLFYALLRRWVKDWWALAAAVLFGTQPLLYGHAFINPKDIPSMVVFLAAVLAGLWMADKLEASKPPVAEYGRKLLGLMQDDWASFKEGTRRMLRFSLWGIAGLGLLWVLRIHRLAVAGVVNFIYQADPNTWLGQQAASLMPNMASQPVDGYIARAQAVSRWAVLGVLIGLLLIVFVAGLFLFQRTRTNLWQESVPTYFRKGARLSRAAWWAVILAGGVWGLAIATRASNMVAGLMIGLYLVLRLREKSILPLVVYSLAAVVVCYAAWPYLWYFGLQGFLGAMQAFANYPYLGGRIWLRGSIPHEEIPRTFLLQVIAIQYTIPMLVLSAVGVVVGVVLAVRKKLPRVDVFILMCWFFLPILYSIIARPIHYNNFRQFFFITTPLFVFAGLAMEKGAALLKNRVVLAAALVVVFLPGLVGMVRLHPYQYVYYNQIVGGPEGAYRYYEMDYWVIGYKEAIEYINANAPEDAEILVVGGGDVTNQYLRKDLHKIPLGASSTEEDLSGYDYVLLGTNHRASALEHAYALPTVYEVKAGEAVLVYVKQVVP